MHPLQLLNALTQEPGFFCSRITGTAAGKFSMEFASQLRLWTKNGGKKTQNMGWNWLTCWELLDFDAWLVIQLLPAQIAMLMDQWTNSIPLFVYPPILETPKELSCWVSFEGIQQVGEEINRPLISPLTFPIFASNHRLQFCFVGWFASFPKKAITISDSILWPTKVCWSLNCHVL